MRLKLRLVVAKLGNHHTRVQIELSLAPGSGTQKGGPGSCGKTTENNYRRLRGGVVCLALVTCHVGRQAGAAEGISAPRLGNYPIPCRHFSHLSAAPTCRRNSNTNNLAILIVRQIREIHALFGIVTFTKGLRLFFH
jgi:hypothetical protein